MVKKMSELNAQEKTLLMRFAEISLIRSRIKTYEEWVKDPLLHRFYALHENDVKNARLTHLVNEMKSLVWLMQW